MIRWICRGLSLLLLGPAAAWAAAGVRAPDGSGETTLLTGASIVGGVIALAMVGVCVVLAGAISARLSDRHEAVLNIGFVFGWLAWTSGRLGEIFRLAPEATTLFKLAAEAIVLGLIIGFAWMVSDRICRKAPSEEGLGLSLRDITASLLLKAGLPTLGVSLALGLVLAWLFARHDGAGQSLGTAFLGGIGAGVFGSLVFQSVLKDEDSGLPGVTAMFIPIALGLMLAGVIGPAIGLVMPGGGKLLDGVARGGLPGWVLVSPSAWAAGALIGVPAGMSFLQTNAAQQASAGSAARA